MAHLTPIQQRLFDLLRDGCRHSAADLIRAVDVEWDLNNLRVQISHLRKRLPNGHDIMCRRDGAVVFYAYVRVVSVK